MSAERKKYYSTFLRRPVRVTEDVITVGGQWEHSDTAATQLVKRTLMIDPGTFTGRTAVFNNLQGARVAYILLTHVDLDHGLAAEWWKRFFLSKGCETKIVVPWGAKEILANGDKILMAGSIYGLHVPRIVPDILIKPGVLERGDLKITAIDTSGHINKKWSHFSYLVDNVLVMGDLDGHLSFEKSLYTDKPRSSLELQLESMERVLEYPFEIAVMSHTDATVANTITRSEFIKMKELMARTYGDLSPGFRGMWNPRND